jgi:biotin carboxyl carrier protein
LSGRTERLRARIGDRELDVELDLNAWPEVRAAISGVRLEAGVFEVASGVYWLTLSGRQLEAHVARQGEGYRVECGGEAFELGFLDRRARLRSLSSSSSASATEVRAPMPGRVIEVLVLAGARVQAGEGLLTLEAMKMQNVIASPRDGVVTLRVAPGQAVEAGALLATLGEAG